MREKRKRDSVRTHLGASRSRTAWVKRMHLYHLTLQPPTAISQAVVGNFSGARQQEILVSRGSRLELLRADSNGKITTVLAQDAFGSIRSLAALRLTGGTKGKSLPRLLGSMLTPP